MRARNGTVERDTRHSGSAPQFLPYLSLLRIRPYLQVERVQFGQLEDCQQQHHGDVMKEISGACPLESGEVMR